MNIQIKNRWNQNIILETDAESLGAAIIEALAAKANLNGANLGGVELSGAELRGAELCGADLRGADLKCVDLSFANLREADLRDADLRDADLRDANLGGADLRGAELCGADLRGADLRGAGLRDADLQSIYAIRTIVPDGDLIGWKKLADGSICKLSIPVNAKRVGGLVGRKCRCEFAVVLEGNGQSRRLKNFAYTPGMTVSPDSYDPNPLIECSHGIQFFITRKEAEDYKD